MLLCTIEDAFQNFVEKLIQIEFASIILAAALSIAQA